MHSRICPVCNAAFVPRYGNQVCCSDKCQAARNNRLKKLSDANRYRFRDQKSEIAFRRERREKARRRAEFLAARDRAFEKAGQPIPQIEERGGVREARQICRARRDLQWNALHTPVTVIRLGGMRIERRGTVPAGGRAVSVVSHNA